MHRQTKLTVHGTPVTPRALLDQLAGESFCVSFADPRDAERCVELVGEHGLLLLDNGAFSHWRTGGTMTDEYVERFEAWAQDILNRCPQAVVVLPDEIEGTVEDNARLINESLLPPERSMPVWHMHEPVAVFLHYASAGFPWVAIGSSGAYAAVGTAAWRARIEELFAAIDAWEAASNGAYSRPRIHMMRGLAVLHDFPFDSADSTNVARNHCRTRGLVWHVEAMAARIDEKVQSSCTGNEARWQLARPIVWDWNEPAWLTEYKIEQLAAYEAARAAREAAGHMAMAA